MGITTSSPNDLPQRFWQCAANLLHAHIEISHFCNDPNRIEPYHFGMVCIRQAIRHEYISDCVAHFIKVGFSCNIFIYASACLRNSKLSYFLLLGTLFCCQRSCSLFLVFSATCAFWGRAVFFFSFPLVLNRCPCSPTPLWDWAACFLPHNIGAPLFYSYYTTLFFTTHSIKHTSILVK